MKFAAPIGPHWHDGTSVSLLMRKVMLALLPVIGVSIWFLGPGVLLNLGFAIGACLALEYIALKARKRPARLFLTDGSIIVTGALLALTLPPLVPWWVTATACVFAVIFAKHLYGGLGFNVFNPAMVGYVVVLIAFPQQMAAWPVIDPAYGTVSLASAIECFLHGTAPGTLAPDIYTGATPLDTVKMELGRMLTMTEILELPGLGGIGGYGWLWINLAALAGGSWLLRAKVIRWHIPVAMLAALAGLAFVFYALDSATHPSPLFEILSGGTMIGVFFVATDPVSAATSDRGRLIYGAGIGVLCFSLRRWGSNPDGLAFAILLMNMAVPLIDRFTLPRVYGHRDRP